MKFIFVVLTLTLSLSTFANDLPSCGEDIDCKITEQLAIDQLIKTSELFADNSECGIEDDPKYAEFLAKVETVHSYFCDTQLKNALQDNSGTSAREFYSCMKESLVAYHKVAEIFLEEKRAQLCK